MNRHILIVDDDAIIRQILSTHLSARGYHCQLANDGKEALAILAKGQVEVLITDLEMPHLDGIALLKAVRTQGLITRCIVVTGYATISNLTACLREGATALISKPLTDLQPLDEAVDQAFEQMRRWADQLSTIIQLRQTKAPEGHDAR